MDIGNIIFVVVFFVAWVVLMRFVFPRLGVPT
jgi:hypothetical protein